MSRSNAPTAVDFAVSADGRPAIQRYSANERSNHWLTAICFVLLALSGLALFHPAMAWLSFVLGGGPWTRILHPFIGVVMFLSFLGLVLRFWRHNRIEADDRRWLGQLGDVIHDREDRLPPVGRYNGGQKLLFWTLLLCMLMLLLSGLAMWREYFSGLLPIGVVRLASLLHAFFGFVIICAIIVHVYAGIWVKGSMGAMLRGRVSYGWARRHHRRWYDEVVAREQSLARGGAQPAQPPQARH